MKSLLTALCALFLLAGCTTASMPPPSGPGDPPPITAPLRATNADEKAIKLAFDGFDTLLSAVDALVAAKVLVPGTPRALSIQSALIRVKAALNAAAAAQQAGNATSYAAAIADAQAAFEQAKSAIKESRP